MPPNREPQDRQQEPCPSQRPQRQHQEQEEEQESPGRAGLPQLSAEQQLEEARKRIQVLQAQVSALELLARPLPEAPPELQRELERLRLGRGDLEEQIALLKEQELQRHPTGT